MNFAPLHVYYTIGVEIDKLYPNVEKDIVEFNKESKENASLDEYND